jgi:hypothetical protein
MCLVQTAQALGCLPSAAAARKQLAMLVKTNLRSYLHRNRLLSTEAQARLISGNTPQKHMVWQVRYFSCTIAGSSGEVGDTVRSREGHCTRHSSNSRTWPDHAQHRWQGTASTVG